MGGNLRFYGLCTVLSYCRPRSFFVCTNEAAVTDDIGHKYRSKTAFNAFIGHSLASPLMGEVYGRRVVVSMNVATSGMGQTRSSPPMADYDRIAPNSGRQNIDVCFRGNPVVIDGYR
jgi:hypothetical protein